MSIGNDTRRTVRDLEAQTGHESFQWAGGDYPCVPNLADSSKSLGLGGFELEADLTLFVRAEVLPDPGPSEEKTITFRKRTYRIKHKGLLAGGTVYRFGLMDAQKGLNG